MKRSILLTAAAAAAVAFSTGAAAAAVGASADSTRAFAECAVKQYEGAELLATQPGSPEEADVLSEFSRRACVAPSQPSNILRGAVAEQLFKADFSSIGSRPKRELIEIFTVEASDVEAMDPASRRRLGLLGFGTCVAAGDPVRSVGLLQARSGSPEEARIVAELQSQFSPCLEQGETLNVGKTELRGALAEGAYRLAVAHSLDGDIVVTGTRDPSRSVICKMRLSAGSNLRQKSCMTAAQWTTREREDRIAMEDMARKTREHDEQRETVEVRSRFPGGQ